VVAREARLFVDRDALVLKSSAPSAHYHQVLGGTGLALAEPVVPRHVWISLMKLSEFLQTAYQKVVEWFFCPVLAFWIVEPLDKVENPFVIASPSLGRRHPISDHDRIVVSKFRHWEQRYPVFLFPVDERSKVGLNRLVEAFRLSVCLWVECG